MEAFAADLVEFGRDLRQCVDDGWFDWSDVHDWHSAECGDG
jgi:hypothetical protein